MKSFLIACVALAIVAPRVIAQSSESRFEVSPFAGYAFGGVFGDHTTTFETEPFFFKTRVRMVFENSGAYGLRLSYRVEPRWKLELETWQKRNRFVLESSSPTGNEKGRSRILTTDSIQVFGARTFTGGSVSPFARIGAGAVRLNVGYGLIETHFIATLGAGAEFGLSDRFALRFDAEGHATRMGGDGSLGFSCFLTGDGSPCKRKKWLLDSQVVAGPVVRF